MGAGEPGVLHKELLIRLQSHGPILPPTPPMRPHFLLKMLFVLPSHGVEEHLESGQLHFPCGSIENVNRRQGQYCSVTVYKDPFSEVPQNVSALFFTGCSF